MGGQRLELHLQLEITFEESLGELHQLGPLLGGQGFEQFPAAANLAGHVLQQFVQVGRVARHEVPEALHEAFEVSLHIFATRLASARRFSSESISLACWRAAGEALDMAVCSSEKASRASCARLWRTLSNKLAQARRRPCRNCP